MTEYLSRKLKLLSAFAIIMVIYIHMYYTEGAVTPTLNLLETIVSGFCRTAVPLFYIISGYLFFLKVPDGLKSIRQKIKKRARTLLVPYLIANIFTFLFYCGVNAIALKFGEVSNVLNFNIFDDIARLGIWGTIELVFINPPIAYQLWFVRDLMVMVLLSPLLWLGLKGLTRLRDSGYGWLSAALLGLLFLCGFKFGYCFTFFWFLAGGYIAMARFDIGQATIKGRVAAASAILVFMAVTAQAFGWYNRISGAMTPLFGITFLWTAYDFIAADLKNHLIDWFARYTFFVYLIHEPFLNVFKKLPLLFSRSETTLIISYISIPVIFYVFACWCGSLLKRRFPTAYSIYTGGR